MEERDMFYVEIQNPLEVRRNLLEASRDLLRGLQKYEDLKKVRANKVKEITKLKNILKEINALFNQAKNHMPAVFVKVPEPRVIGKARHAPRIKSAEVDARKPREVAELEKQLKDIEGKLTGLG